MLLCDLKKHSFTDGTDIDYILTHCSPVNYLTVDQIMDHK